MTFFDFILRVDQAKVTRYLTTWLLKLAPYNIMNTIYTVLLIKIDKEFNGSSIDFTGGIAFSLRFKPGRCHPVESSSHSYSHVHNTNLVWIHVNGLGLLVFNKWKHADWDYFHKLNRAAINMLLLFSVKQHFNYL